MAAASIFPDITENAVVNLRIINEIFLHVSLPLLKKVHYLLVRREERGRRRGEKEGGESEKKNTNEVAQKERNPLSYCLSVGDLVSGIEVANKVLQAWTVDNAETHTFIENPLSQRTINSALHALAFFRR